MLTIGQLAAVRRRYGAGGAALSQVGLLPEPERDASGYRRYGATAVVSLIKIRTLANAGVPLSHIRQMLEADAPAFAAAVQRIDSQLRDEIERLRPAASRSRSSLPGTAWRSRRRWSHISTGFGRSGRQSGCWRASGTGGSWSRLAGPIASPRL